MDNKIPAILYLIRSRSKPDLAIVCTELYLAKWVNTILEKGEQPEVLPVTPGELIQFLKPNHNLN